MKTALDYSIIPSFHGMARRGVRSRLAVLVLALAAGLFPGAAAAAGDTPPPSVAVETIVRAALVHSYQLQSLDQEDVAAGARLAQARAAAWPSLDADAHAAHYEGLTASALGPAIAFPLIDNRASAGITLSQPLYTGGRLTAQERAARLQVRAAGERRQAAEADLRLQAVAAYWDWSKAHYAKLTLAAALARMRAHDADTRNLVKAGLAIENDQLATEVRVNQTQLRLATAGRREALARARLKFLTGEALDEQAAPQAAPAAVAALPPPDRDLLAEALQNRTELQARRLEAEAAAVAVRAAHADRRPQMALAARYEQQRPNPFNIPPQDVWQDDAFLGITVTWNIFDWGRSRARIREAAAHAAGARLREAQERDDIALAVTAARIDLLDAADRIAVVERTEESARRNLDSATVQWHNGLARHADVLDAHVQFTDAQYDTVVARTDLLLALAALERAVGRPVAENAPTPEARE